MTLKRRFKMEGELTKKLQEIIHKCQAWVDDERYIPKKFGTKSQSEEYAEKIRTELESEMVKQKFSFQNERIYLPTKYVIDISEADSLEFGGIKREILISELNKFVERCFRLLSIDYFDNSFIQINTSSELEVGQIKVKHIWEETYQPEIVFNNPIDANNSSIFDENEKTIIIPNFDSFEENENETVVRKNFKRLFCLDVWQNSNFQHSLPIFQPQISIGRSLQPNNVDIVLKDDLQISRHHAILTYQENKTFSFTVTGQNPAFIGSNPIFKGQTATLKLGDIFQIGNYQLKAQI